MFSQNELGKRFANGATSGKASNVEIVETDNETLLVGYGWAVYASRNKQTAEITHYEGWYGYSSSTSCQLSRLGCRANADKIIDKKREN